VYELFPLFDSVLCIDSQPDYVAPFVAALCHPDGPDASGKVFEVAAGFIAEIRWERSRGTIFKTDASFTPSAVRHSFHVRYSF
jgi:multifunctional beta-oxidation protein